MICDETGREDVAPSVLVKALRQPPQPLGSRRLSEARRVVEDPVCCLCGVLLEPTTQRERFARRDIAERFHSQFRCAHVLFLKLGVKMSQRGWVRTDLW